MEERGFALTLVRDEGYRYSVLFDDPDMEPIHLDEPPPLGEGEAPNAVRLLGAAIGNCLAASLQFCMQRARLEVEGISARVEGKLIRNRDGRLRIGDLHVVLTPTIATEHSARFDRCVELFEDFCIVTESVRNGIDVLVEVRPREREVAARAEATPNGTSAAA